MANPAVSLTPCGCRRGVFLVTPCVNAAAARCSRCGIPVCSEHARLQGPVLLCPNCYSSQADDDYRERDGGLSTTSASGTSPSPPDDFAGQGGEFGGGGATSDWADAATEEAGASADGTAQPFTAEDYAAFDSVSDFDKTAGAGHGFDS